MDVKQSFIIGVAPDVVWKAFHDPELLVSCLPGASLREPAENNHLALLFEIKLGPMLAAFSGEGDLTLDETRRTGTLTGRGVDRKSNSRVKGQADFAVSENADGALIELTVTFSITGRLAQFSRQGIVRSLADQLTSDFAENLQDALKQSASEPSGSVVEPAGSKNGNDGVADKASPGASTPRSTAASSRLRRKDTPALNVFGLFWRMFVGFIRRLLK